MRSQIWSRMLLVIPMLLIVSFITFLLVQFSPMDPAEVVLQAQGVPEITEELLAETRQELGMERPLLYRYADWLAASARLEFGDSYVTGKPIWSLLWPALLNTWKLTLISSVIVVIVSVLLGLICALHEGKLIDRSIRGMAFFLTSMPTFWLAAWMIWGLSVQLNLLPTSGMTSVSSYILPVASIVIAYAGLYFRNIRTSVLAQINEDYVLYQRACGLPEWRIRMHVLRNAMQVAISIFAMAIPTIMGSTVVIENVFAWPGLGSLSVKAILTRDFPLIQAYVLLMAVFFICFNLIADLIHAVVNPK
ncbi:nickel/cobalt ABC transporter permease [Marinicrinis sediminis]|uniref:Nickel/cobalt ABC transporter permease n=1 Tax=Marinicrinis sediminis TaxID=1652465 RepID=A0ABW5R7S8_9BACL